MQATPLAAPSNPPSPKRRPHNLQLRSSTSTLSQSAHHKPHAIGATLFAKLTPPIDARSRVPCWLAAAAAPQSGQRADRRCLRPQWHQISAPHRKLAQLPVLSCLSASLPRPRLVLPPHCRPIRPPRCVSMAECRALEMQWAPVLTGTGWWIRLSSKKRVIARAFLRGPSAMSCC